MCKGLTTWRLEKVLPTSLVHASCYRVYVSAIAGCTQDAPLQVQTRAITQDALTTLNGAPGVCAGPGPFSYKTTSRATQDNSLL